jgi:phage regulator Rha-like protein
MGVKHEKIMQTLGKYRNQLEKSGETMSTTASLITVAQSVPLADSREIALTLGIEHRSFFKMILEYQAEIEQDFGPLRFEIAVKEGNRGGEQPRYALLTEEQTYAYMSYSKNTVQARACKRLLVRAFTEVKTRLQQTKSAVHTFLDTLRKRTQANEGRVPHHLFDLGCESLREMSHAEPRLRLQIPDDADVLNSIKRCFWNDREKLGIPLSARQTYKSISPSGRKSQTYACSIEHLHTFRQWFHNDYLVERFPVYLRNRARRIAKQQQIKARDNEALLLPQSEVTQLDGSTSAIA